MHGKLHGLTEKVLYCIYRCLLHIADTAQV